MKNIGEQALREFSLLQVQTNKENIVNIVG